MSARPAKILFTGQSSFSNRGCEAIVRSTADLLHETLSISGIAVPSAGPDLDRHQWPEHESRGVRFFEEGFPMVARLWAHSQRLPIASLKRSFGPPYFSQTLRSELAGADLVMAIGGDNYSLDYRLPSRTAAVDALAMRMGKPVVLWGASVGPFEAQPHFVPRIRDHLNRMSAIVVRETNSFEYLTERLGLENVVASVDPAFALMPSELPPDCPWPNAASGHVIGVNVSPLVERISNSPDGIAVAFSHFVRHLVMERGAGVLLVPHVMPLQGPPRNDDHSYLARLLKENADLGEAVKILPPSLNAAQIKAAVSQLDFFYGARTHATIAALSSGIPTCSISYSIKSIGINRDLLGSTDFVLPATEVSVPKLIATQDVMEQEGPALRILLKSTVSEYRAQLHEGLDSALKLATVL